MTWPDYMGLDPEPARTLAQTTSGWSGSIDSALRNIQAAETLTGEPVGVTLALDDVGNSGRIMSTAIGRAVDTVESYHVPAIDADMSLAPSAQADGNHAGSTQSAAAAQDGMVATVPLTPTNPQHQTAAQDGMVATVPLTPTNPQHQTAATPTHPQWHAAAQDGLVPGGPLARLEAIALDMGEANNAITRLAAEVARLYDGLEAGVETNRRAEALAELHALGRTVAVDEAAGFGVSAGTWVHRDVAATAVEWEVRYDEATLLHRREQVLAEQPTVSGHQELLAIAAALAALHQGASDTDSAESTASGDTPRLRPGVFDGLIAERAESLDDPASLSNESLAIAIENWDVSLGVDPSLLPALVAERDARAAVFGAASTTSLSDEQRVILAAAFTREALGQIPQLAADDIVGNRLVNHLIDAGYPSQIAMQLAATVRAQFPGDQVAAHIGIAAALGADAEMLGTAFHQLPSAADFEAFAIDSGRQAVDELQLQYLDAVLSAYDSYTLIAGEEPSAELLVALADYAIDNGVTFSKVARDYLGLQPSNPPFGRTATELTQPEVVEIRAIIEQERAAYEALLAHRPAEELLAGAGWLFHRHRPNGSASGDAYSAAMSGELDGLFVERAAMQDFIASALGASPTPEQIDAQADFIDELKLVQYATHLQGTDYFDPLDADQIAVLDGIRQYWPELQQLFNPPPSTYAEAYDPFEARDSEFLPRVPLDEIEQALTANEGSPGTLVSAGLAAALRDLLDDPQLIAALTPRESDLHAPARHVGTIDFHRLDNAAIEDLLANVTGPWADEIDAIKSGQDIDGTRVRTDWRRWIAEAEPNPTIPLLVVDSANAVVDAGLYDTSALDASHVVLAILAALPIPILREVAALLDAGLYYAVDQDPAYGTLALSGAVLPGFVGFTRWRLDQADELTRLLGTVDSADEITAALRSVDPTQDLAAAVDGLELTDEVGRGLDQLHTVDNLSDIVIDIERYDQVTGLASAADTAERAVSASSIGTAVHGATPPSGDPNIDPDPDIDLDPNIDWSALDLPTTDE